MEGTPTLKEGPNSSPRPTSEVEPSPTLSTLSNKLVVDIGAQNARLGFAGSAYPEALIPSWVVKNETENSLHHVGHEAISMYHPESELEKVVSRGRVENWDNLEELWKYMQATVLKVNAEEHPVLLCESVLSDASQRSKWAELLFEGCNTPSLFFAREAPLCLFARARTSGLALNVGHSYSYAVPVQDGFYMEDKLETSWLAGSELTEKLLDHLEARQKKTIAPRYKFTRKTNREGEVVVTHVNPPAKLSFEKYWKLDVTRRMKETVCSVNELINWRETDGNEDKDSVNQDNTYKLPDGTEVDLTDEISNGVGEYLFDGSSAGTRKGCAPLHTLALGSVKSIKSAEFRLRLFENIVLTGGTSRLDGLPERLRAEIASISKTLHSKCRVIAGGSQERGLATWLGGSIMASLDSLDESIWISKSEYMEKGSDALQKCP